MDILEIAGLLLLVLGLALIAWIALRRTLLVRSGAIDLCWRDRLDDDGRGWYLGLAKFEGADLQLFRSFSPLPWPNRSLDRVTLSLGDRRIPAGAELDLLPRGAVIIRCTDGAGEFELGMTDAALTGLSSWLESTPPGSRFRRNDVREL